MDQPSSRIAELNDAFRRAATGTVLGQDVSMPVQGRLVVTQGVAALAPLEQVSLLQKVRLFEDFSDANDPYGEHDFGEVHVGEQPFFWKINYYDADLCKGSEDPADPAVTTRSRCCGPRVTGMCRSIIASMTRRGMI